jgi:hypothetical protein
MQSDEVQKRVAEVAKALYHRTDEPAVAHAHAITGRMPTMAALQRQSSKR